MLGVSMPEYMCVWLQSYFNQVTTFTAVYSVVDFTMYHLLNM